MRETRQVLDLSEKETLQRIASLCDHTFLKTADAFAGTDNPVALRDAAFRSFLEATTTQPLRPYAVCVPAADVSITRRHLEDAGWGDGVIVSIAGFPNGAVPTAWKVTEARYAVAAGAQEVDMVLNVPAMQNNQFNAVVADIAEVVKAVHAEGGLLKLIVECAALSSEHIAKACQLADEAGVDFVKTSTGYHTHGATAEALRIMRQHFPRGIKMSGGVTLENVGELLAAMQPFAWNPATVRIGESKLLQQLCQQYQTS